MSGDRADDGRTDSLRRTPRGTGEGIEDGNTPWRTLTQPHAWASSTDHVLSRERNGRGVARLAAHAPEVGGACLRVPRAVPGRGCRHESRVGDGGRPVLPVPVGGLLEAREQRQLAVHEHPRLR